MGASKHDSGKDCRPGLIAPEMLIGMGKVLAFGARKYAAGNWALGMDWSRPIDALDRHWLAWKSGEARDPETGYSHLWHVACCLMFLIAYEARGVGRDDRTEAGITPAAPASERAATGRQSYRPSVALDRRRLRKTDRRNAR